MPWRTWRPCPHTSLEGVALVIGAVLLTGCAERVAANASSLLDQAGRTLEHRLYVQELNNVARFLAEPEALPQYIRIQRGTIESRPEPKWSFGTDTYLSGSTRMAIVWEFSAVTDPGDLERMRLLFQWVTRRISLDEFERRWDEIRDQPEVGVDGKPLVGSSGRPVMGAAPRPISRDSSQDWYTTNENDAAGALDKGAYREVKVWIKDLRGASMFALAVQRAMPNSKRRRRRRGPVPEPDRRARRAHHRPRRRCAHPWWRSRARCGSGSPSSTTMDERDHPRAGHPDAHGFLAVIRVHAMVARARSR